MHNSRLHHLESEKSHKYLKDFSVLLLFLTFFSLFLFRNINFLWLSHTRNKLNLIHLSMSNDFVTQARIQKKFFISLGKIRTGILIPFTFTWLHTHCQRRSTGVWRLGLHRKLDFPIFGFVWTVLKFCTSLHGAFMPQSPGV